ncbi:hypothetical protein SEA_BANTAM_103 [Gordonia phage Bantam]|uniref:Uncharacterized protein n=1 Tax=Gordonia phage Bantam TaxID=1887641 RepID=A0A1B3AYH4_9CAUD|nr:hypothetical protein BIZ77_gp076 [Gordonia phage Bantam]AOE43792.1 hypothetical protein SEA_BANTAM_103 [Gordonia phage Bantam]
MRMVRVTIDDKDRAKAVITAQEIKLKAGRGIFTAPMANHVAGEIARVAPRSSYRLEGYFSSCRSGGFQLGLATEEDAGSWRGLTITFDVDGNVTELRRVYPDAWDYGIDVEHGDEGAWPPFVDLMHADDVPDRLWADEWDFFVADWRDDMMKGLY